MTDNQQSRAPMIIALALGLLMGLTRFEHVGSVALLPDASWAVFFLAGYYLRHMGWMAAYLALAGLIDYIATSKMGVSDWCITPAYLFLVPAYAVLWMGGAWLRRSQFEGWKLAATGVIVATVSVLGTFVISNASFYLLSGKFESMALVTYVQSVAPYFSMFLSTTLMYLAFAALLHVAVLSLFKAPADRQSKVS